MKELKKWMPMFWGEYFGKTKHLSCVEHGAYLQLIGYYWTKGSLPTEDAQLARICSLHLRDWQRIKHTIKAFFNPDMTHDRIDTEIRYAIEKSKTLSANARNRYCKSKASADTPTPTPTPTKKRKIKTPVAEPPEFLDFWASYPRKTGRHPALVAYCKAGETGDYAQINAAAKRFNIEMAKTDEKYIPHPATWLNQRRYEDYHVQIERDTNLKWDETAKTWRWKDGCDPERTN